MPENINWGSVADWASAVGSVAASITALYLARQTAGIHLEGYFGLRITIGGGAPIEHLVMLHVTNTGTRSTRVTHIALRVGLPPRRRYALIPNWAPGVSSPLPATLNDGETAQWCVMLDDTDWLGKLCSGEGGFVKTWLEVETFRIEVLSTNGAKLLLKPEAALKKRMHEIRKGTVGPLTD